MTSSPRPHLPAGDLTPSDGRQPILLLAPGCAGPRSRRTRPGERVLPLAPPSGSGVPTPGPCTEPRARTGSGLLPALIESAGIVSRLGRALEARIEDPHVAARTGAGASPTKGQSVQRLPSESVPAPTDHRPVRRRRGPAAVGPGHFDEAIVPVDPRYSDWGARVSWSGPSWPSGAFALTTHSDRHWGGLVAPRGLEAGVACGAGLTPLDRVVLPHVTSGARTVGGSPPVLTEATGTTSRLGRRLEAVLVAAGIAGFAPEAASWPGRESVHQLPSESVLLSLTLHGLLRCRPGLSVVGPDAYEPLAKTPKAGAAVSNTAGSRARHGARTLSLHARQLRLGDFR